MLYERRDRFSGIDRRIGKAFSFLPPNAWTVLSVIAALPVLYFIIREDFVLAAIMFAAAAFFDKIDGSVARFAGKVTKRGAYIDTIADRYVEFIAVTGLLFISVPSLILPFYLWMFLFLFGSMMTTYAKASAKEKLDKEIKGGVLERSERMALLFAGILLAYFSKSYLAYIIAFMAIFSNITALQRIRKALTKVS